MMLSLIPRTRRNDLTWPHGDLHGLVDKFFASPWSAEREGKWWPSLDVSEDKEKLNVTVEIPGLESKDIDISLHGDLLTISGEKKRESEEKEENYHRLERTYGSFSRSLRLPHEVDPDKVKAKYEKGVLTLTIPKAEAAKTRQIEIEAK